jgi:hypothetical protein
MIAGCCLYGPATALLPLPRSVIVAERDQSFTTTTVLPCWVA